MIFVPFSLRSKIVLMLLLPLAIIVGYAWLHVMDHWRLWNRAEGMEVLADTASTLTDLIYDIQKERGYSSGFLASSGQLFQKDLVTQREKTDGKLQNLQKVIEALLQHDHDTSPLHNTLSTTLQLLKPVTELRQAVDKLNINAQQVIADYTIFNDALLHLLGRMIRQATDIEITHKFFALLNLLHISEELGKERALLTHAFITDHFTPGAYEKFQVLHGERIAHTETFLAFATTHYATLLQTLNTDAANTTLDRFRKLVISRHHQGGFETDAQEWFSAITRRIDRFFGVGAHIRTDIRTMATKQTRLAMQNYWSRIVAAFVLVLAVILLALERQQREAEQRKLYYALDQSPITVLITDIKGAIEYTNQSCLQLTGYSREELLGQTPRIFKSGHVPEMAYKKVWDTLLSGETWQGEFHNRKKDGSLFWESAFMSPIRDIDGSITHFIAIKEDITEKKRQAQDMAYRLQMVEQVAQGVPLAEIYALAKHCLEETSPGVVGCLSVLDQNQQLLRCTAPSKLIPSDLHNILCPAQQDITVTPDAMVCAAAVYRKKMVCVENIISHPHWSKYKEPLQKAGFQTFCSLPILGEGGEVLGTFSSYYLEARRPERRFLERLTMLAQLVGIAITRHRREEALRLSAEKALAANESKNQFLANMSHEIRTPLNAVLGMLELLQDAPLEQNQREQLHLAFASARTLLTLINGILDYSKIEAGQFQLDTVDFELRELLDEITLTMAPTAHQKKIELTAFLPGKLPTQLQGDPNRIRQIFINLIGNAIKFTDEGGVVEILGGPISQDKSHIELIFEVRDNGIGIPEEHRQLIFERFTQVDNGTERRFGGTGLGLAICRDLVTMMAGEIGVDNNPFADSGTVFYFTIRLQKQKSAQTKLKKIDNGIPASQSAPLKGVHTLIVGSEGAQLAFLCDALQGWGTSHCESVYEVEAAMNLLRQKETFTLVVVNQKPGHDRLQALRQLHSVKHKARFVLLVDLLAQGGEESAALLGETLCLQKPFIVEQALPKITRLLQKDISDTWPPKPLPEIHGETTTLQTATILVVDDQKTNLKVTQGMLAKLGCNPERIHCVADGQQAVEQFQNGTFDLVLMDCQMPIMDGYQASRTIRSWEQAQGKPSTPIIAFTADITTKNRQNGKAAGMDAFLIKPVFLKALRAILDTYLTPSIVDSHPGITPGVTQADTPKKAITPAAILAELAQNGFQEKEGVREVAELLLAQFPPLMTSLEKDLRKKNGKAAQATTHTLKGSVANTLFPSLLKPTEALHDTVKKRQWSTAMVKFERLQAVFTPIQNGLLQIMESADLSATREESSINL